MSVTSDVNVKIDTSTLRQGTIKFWGYTTVTGDATGGSYFYGFTADPSLVRMFPGRNYWVLTGCNFITGGALVNPTNYLIWFTFENGATEWSAYIGSGGVDSVSDGGANRIWQDARYKRGMLPYRWYAIDSFYSGTGYVARARIDPNTNGVATAVHINGLICNEDYILRHGMFLPS